MRSVGVRIGLLGALLGTVMVGAFLFQAGRIGTVEGEPYTVGFPTTGRFNVMLSQGDGQAFAALATDPSLARPEQFVGQTAATREGVEAAYRAQRPVLVYLVWATSLGQPDLVGPAMAFWAVVGAGSAVGAVAHLLHLRGAKRPELALLLLLLLGSVQSLSWLGPELLGIALVFGAWALVGRHFGWAVAALCVAGLVKESFLLFAAVLGLGLLLRRDIWRAALMGLPIATYLAWLQVVHARFDAWPSEANAGRVSGPFEGLADAWDQLRTFDIAVVVLTFALILLALPFIKDPLSWIVIGSAGLAVFAGWDVWINSAGINRTMLPAYIALGVLFLTGVQDPYDPGRAARGTDRRDRVGEVDGVVPAG